MKKLAISLLTLPMLFGSAADTFAKTGPHTEASSKNAVYYEIYVNAFADSNKDGYGDLNGINQKLDYLNDGNPHNYKEDLGVNGLWLMPIFPSPSYHKYDTTDFYNVDPKYGTLEDFRRLAQEAHKRGVKVILDLALNHTSSEHPWFKEAMKDKNSPYRDYYIWADENTDINDREPWGNKVWHETYPGSGDYYYGLFWSGMPDLNFDNPKVREEMVKIGQFWLNQGADGFRLDAAMHIYSSIPDHTQSSTRDGAAAYLIDYTWKNVEVWNEFRQGLEAIKPDVYLTGEVWDRPQYIAPYYEELDSLFNFDLSSKIKESVQYGHDAGVASFAKYTNELYQTYGENAIDAPFLTNHDEVRIMSELEGDVNKAKMAASLLLTMPGNPYIYYGEEIGMLGEKPDEFIREPFRWYPGNGEGQSTWEAPMYNVGVDAASVESQTDDKDSLLNYYRKLIHYRQNSMALIKGDIQEVTTGNSSVVGYSRNVQEDSAVVLNNVSAEEVSIELTGQDYQKRKVDFSTSKDVKIKKTGNGIQMTIPAYTTVILN